MAELAAGTTVAGVFTRNQCPGAPVDWCREALKGGRARALVVNAGNANVFTGRAGVAAAKATAAAAAGLVGPLEDLVALGRELAAPTLIDPETHRAFTSVQFPGLSGVLPGFQVFDPCPWGLGTEIRGAKHPHWTGTGNSPSTYGHFGRTGSFLWIDPVAGLLCAGLSDRPFGPWAATAWPRLADAILDETARTAAPVEAPATALRTASGAPGAARR